MGAFSSSPSPSGASVAPLPPLPDLQSAAAPGPGGSSDASPMAALMSGIMPVKSGVDLINQGCQMIVQSGVIPGAEQICGEIIAKATSLLPMAAQAAMQSAGPMGAPGGAPGGMSMMPPPGGPAPLGGM